MINRLVFIEVINSVKLNLQIEHILESFIVFEVLFFMHNHPRLFTVVMMICICLKPSNIVFIELI